MPTQYDDLANGEAEYQRIEILATTPHAILIRQHSPFLADVSPTDKVWCPLSVLLNKEPTADRYKDAVLYSITVKSWFARQELEGNNFCWDWIDDLHADLDRNMQKGD